MSKPVDGSSADTMLYSNTRWQQWGAGPPIAAGLGCWRNADGVSYLKSKRDSTDRSVVKTKKKGGGGGSRPRG